MSATNDVSEAPLSSRVESSFLLKIQQDVDALTHEDLTKMKADEIVARNFDHLTYWAVTPAEHTPTLFIKDGLGRFQYTIDIRQNGSLAELESFWKSQTLEGDWKIDKNKYSVSLKSRDPSEVRAEETKHEQTIQRVLHLYNNEYALASQALRDAAEKHLSDRKRRFEASLEFAYVLSKAGFKPVIE